MNFEAFWHYFRTLDDQYVAASNNVDIWRESRDGDMFHATLYTSFNYFFPAFREAGVVFVVHHFDEKTVEGLGIAVVSGVELVIDRHERMVVRLQDCRMKEVLATLVIQYDGEAAVAVQECVRPVLAIFVSVDKYFLSWSELIFRLVWVCRIHCSGYIEACRNEFILVSGSIHLFCAVSDSLEKVIIFFG